MYFVKNIKKTFCTVKCVSKEAFFFFASLILCQIQLHSFGADFIKFSQR